MMSLLTPTALAVIALAVLFGVLSGFRDAANIVATMIASRAIGPRRALIIAALATAAGPFIFGVSVATTIGRDFITPQAATLPVITAALLASLIWNTLTAWLGIPASSMHALAGGLIGAAVLDRGWLAINFSGVGKVLLALLISPLAGLVAGYAIMKLISLLASSASPRINIFFKRGQLITTLALGLAYGANDGQKSIGVIALILIVAKPSVQFQIPLEVVLLGAGAVAVGMSIGGRRLMKTLGGKFYTVRPVHAFSAQLAASVIVIGAALLGGPVSSTQVVSTAIMGVGGAERLSKVRWRAANSIVLAWVLTLPICAALAAGGYALLRSSALFG
jgi:PiT family inorganic phosphate transporter